MGFLLINSPVEEVHYLPILPTYKLELYIVAHSLLNPNKTYYY